MSFIKNPSSVLVDLTDVKKLNDNLFRIEKDELLIIKRIKLYDKKIERLHERIKKKGTEIKDVLKKINKAKPNTKKFSDLLKKKNKIRLAQEKLGFIHQSNIIKEQEELIKYYKDLISSVTILKKMRKLKKHQSKNVHKTIKLISKHLKK